MWIYNFLGAPVALAFPSSAKGQNLAPARTGAPRGLASYPWGGGGGGGQHGGRRQRPAPNHARVLL
jgi:hypothetical protein